MEEEVEEVEEESYGMEVVEDQKNKEKPFQCDKGRVHLKSTDFLAVCSADLVGTPPLKSD